MENYERYNKVSSQQYDKKTVMSFFCSVPSDRKLIPFICEIENKKILDVGMGTGKYTRHLIDNDSVVGIDQNPHLSKLEIKVHKGDATNIIKLVNGEKFDIVFSTWMTEYLNPEQLNAFFSESKKVLNNNGKLITTVISNWGFGFAYVSMAKIVKGIDKYNYSKKNIIKSLNSAGFNNINIVKLNSWLTVPWAYLVIAQ